SLAANALCGMPAFGQNVMNETLVIEDGGLILDAYAPEIQIYGENGSWLMGIDVANWPGQRDLVLAAKMDWPYDGWVNDLIYISHNGSNAPTVGIGVTPPIHHYRLQVSPEDREPEMGGLLLRRGPHQVGDLFTVMDSAGAVRLAVDNNYWFKGAHKATGSSVAIKGDTDNERTLVFATSLGTATYGWQYTGNQLNFRYFTTGLTNFTAPPSGQPRFPNGLSAASITLDKAAGDPTGTSCAAGTLSFSDDFIY